MAKQGDPKAFNSYEHIDDYMALAREVRFSLEEAARSIDHTSKGKVMDSEEGLAVLALGMATERSRILSILRGMLGSVAIASEVGFGSLSEEQREAMANTIKTMLGFLETSPTNEVMRLLTVFESQVRKGSADPPEVH